MDQQNDQEMRSVELHIWRDEGGAWRCLVQTPAGSHTAQLDNQPALSAYIANQIDMFVDLAEQLSQAD